MSLVHDDHEMAQAERLRQMGVRVTAIRVPRLRNLANAALRLPGPQPLTHLLLAAPGLTAMLDRIVAERPPDVVLAYCSGMARFALESPDLQAQYGTPAALRDDVIAHYAPFPAIASARFLDIVTFRGLPTYRMTLFDDEGATTTAYYLVRRLDDGSLRIAGCVLVRVPSS